MIEWWEAVLIACASAALTGLAAFVVQARQQSHDKAMQSDRLKEERLKEAREARRKIRQERVQPVRQFIEDVRSYVGHDDFRRALLPTYDRNFMGIRESLTREQFESEMKNVAFRGQTAVKTWLRDVMVAVMSAPTDDMKTTILAVLANTGNTEERRPLTEAIRRVEELIEEYVVNVEGSG